MVSGLQNTTLGMEGKEAGFSEKFLIFALSEFYGKWNFFTQRILKAASAAWIRTNPDIA